MGDVQTYTLQWAGLDIEVRYWPNWCEAYREVYGYPLAHLEIDACRQSLPITATGYRSRFDRPDNIDAAGGPVAFVRAWLDFASREPAWQAMQAAHRQLSLF